MLKSYNLLNSYTEEEINAIEEALLESTEAEEVAKIIEYENFTLYEGCHTLEEVETEYEIETDDINETWIDTKVGMIIVY